MTFEVSGDRDGERVERLLMEALGCSRNEARSLCERGLVRMDGRRVPKGARVRAGAVLAVELEQAGVIAEPQLGLDVRLERDDLLVVVKPAGMPSAPLAPGERGTLANALVARYPELRGFGHSLREPGLVHRLDTQTSGLLLVARNFPSFKTLTEGLRGGRLEKRYLAVVPESGLPDEGLIDSPLAPDPRRRGRVRVATELSGYQREATTKFRVLRRGSRWALVEVDAKRAFRHQVRAHLSELGFPIAGDLLYGGTALPELGARHALHASRIEWVDSGVPAFRVEDGAPGEFLGLVDR